MIPLDEPGLRGQLSLFLPLIVCGVFTGFVLAVQWFVGRRSDPDQRFQQHQFISKGASR